MEFQPCHHLVFLMRFGSNPPTVISPGKKSPGQYDQTHIGKYYDTKEVVINAVSYSMVIQVSLPVVNIPEVTNEFEKSGVHACTF
jgi:hypothetical protein